MVWIVPRNGKHGIEFKKINSEGCYINLYAGAFAWGIEPAAQNREQCQQTGSRENPLARTSESGSGDEREQKESESGDERERGLPEATA